LNANLRIGVFGGSFDPVHWGHLILAEQCREQARLDAVWFVPTAHHPFKAHQGVTPFEHRVAMLNLAIGDAPGMAVNETERDLPAPTYTINTLEALANQHPGTDWRLLLGGDALDELPTWHEPDRIVQRASLVTMARPGHAIPSVDQVRERLSLAPTIPLGLQVVDVPLIDLSSRDIRRRVAAGRSIRFLAPAAVVKYIREMELYR
jgi:nicotinate-nucleotide adenylyltransferase